MSLYHKPEATAIPVDRTETERPGVCLAQNDSSLVLSTAWSETSFPDSQSNASSLRDAAGFLESLEPRTSLLHPSFTFK